MGIGKYATKSSGKAGVVKPVKTAKQMERHLKGVANHRRIDIILLVASQEGITVEGIAESLDSNFKTISEHVRRLVQAGLMEKKYKGRNVVHNLSPYGRIFTTFLQTFSHS
jgi:predicted transcriptional regulator